MGSNVAQQVLVLLESMACRPAGECEWEIPCGKRARPGCHDMAGCGAK